MSTEPMAQDFDVAAVVKRISADAAVTEGQLEFMTQMRDSEKQRADDLAAEVACLRRDEETAKRVIGDLTTVGVKEAGRARRAEQEAERLRRLYDRAEKARIAAQARLNAVTTVKVWTNKDGKRFVFADELYAALVGKEETTDEH